MKTGRKNQILREISLKETQMERLEPYIKVSKMSNDFYNKLLIERAVLKKGLNLICETKISRFFKNLFKPRKKLICDYFKDNCPMI